jgi:hypothetical protein
MYQDDSFERMLKQKADEYRMYPTDQSWDVIYNQLHKPNRFYWKAATFFTAALLTAGLWVSINQHEVKPAVVAVSSNPGLETTAKLKTTIITTGGVTVNNTFQRNNKSSNAVAPEQQETIAVNSGTKTDNAITNVTNTAMPSLEQTVTAEPVLKEVELIKTGAQELRSLTIPAAAFASIAETNQQLASNNTSPQTNTVEPADENKTDADLNYEVHVPVLMHKPLPKAQLQFHITPSASYRVLVSDNRFNFGNLRDPESAVKHRTSLGFEAAATFVKPLSKTSAFTAGVQFNFTNYTVVGSRYNPELATVILNSARNVQRYTDLRTQNGYFPEDISNRTYQFSLPIGLQLRLMQTKKFSWNIGTSIQPTYQFNSTGYLVTNDYKNYIKAPEFIRSFNLNYSIETFIRLNANKKTQFFLGPQFRYQLFSNSKGNYPVQEHLVDYGFRIGFIKTLK